jgi:biopolymer transport protein ExbB
MLPIVLLSCLVVTIGLERLVALRAGRLLPAGLLKGLGELARLPDGLPVERAYQLCMRHPSAASAIARTMLLKVGRPQSEIEHAVQEASQREADRCYGRVRWLNLAAGIAPLLGLLGTVWGLIRAFYDTTQLGVAENRAEHLAQGIYEALVTTLAGLLVAIPAAILAHWFEDRIRNRFRDIDQLMFYLMTRIERYEGRQRFEHQQGELVATQREAGS